MNAQSFYKLIGINIAIAIAYILLGKFGLALALPPGYASAIWPPAGLAFAACILWRGRRVWPGIMLGSVLINAGVGDRFHLDNLAFIIAIGSTLQAIVGGWAARRIDPGMLLNRFQTILWFSVVGIAAALIASTVGNAGLYWNGAITVSQLPQTFTTWWLGDAFGIQIFTPLMLLLFDRRAAWRIRRFSVGLPLLSAFLLCGLVYYYVRDKEERQLFGTFHSQLDQVVADLHAVQQSHLQAVNSTAAFIEAAPDSTAQQFEQMTTRLFPSAPGIRGLSWSPFIYGNDVNEYNAISQRLWGKPISLKRWASWQPTVDSVTLPVTLISPLKGNEAALGFDLHSEPIRAAAIDTMRASGQTVISHVIKLVQDPKGPGGVLIFAPVHKQNMVVAAVSGVLDLRHVEAVLAKYPGVQWQLSEREPSPGPNKSLVFLSNIRGAIPNFADAAYMDRSGIYLRESIKLSDREWELLLHRPQAGLIAQSGLAPLLVLFLALSMCTVLANLALILSGERQRIGEEVEDKTRDLRAEMLERSKAESARARQLENLATLNQISALPDEELAVHLRRGLEIGSAMLGLECGLVSHVSGEDFEILAQTAACPPQLATMPLKLSMTYCSLPLAANKVVAIEHMATSPYANHLCYATFHLEAYIGAPVLVNGEIYGTVNFASPIAYGRDFDEGDSEFLRLLAKWVGTSIERALAVEQLRSAKVAAEMASDAKSQFLASMSHEIRTPMNGILGMLKLLEHSELNTRQLDYTNKAQAATLALLGIINDILDFSKVEAGKMEIENNPFSINEVMHDLSVLLSANLDHRDIELLFDLDATIPKDLQGDALRLRQVLLNLTGNAIKFTEQGEVVLSTRLLERSPNTATIEFSVQDTGIGIEPQKLSYIFEGFSQAEASTTRRFGGSGLGLAISKNLVALMGGDLQVESTVGKGSRFYFTLTLNLVNTEVPSTSIPLADEHGFRVLIVDNHVKARSVLQTMVAAMGWQSHAVSSGPEAIAYLEQEGITQHQLILMDLNMPGMDGWATTRKIRQLKQGGLVPVVLMVTAHGRELLAEKTKNEAEQVDGYVLKPLTASMLHDAIAGIMHSRIEQPKHQQNQLQTKPLAGLRLLVVEDNPLNQQVARELLSRSGAEVTIAGGGIEGVEQALAAKPAFDAILMDMQMPDIDGLEASRRIRAHERMLAVPIIAMTANAMASDKQACLAAGMVDHVSKPINLDDLVNALLRHTQDRPPAEKVVSNPIPAVILKGDNGIDVDAALQRLGGNRALYEQIIRVFPSEADIQLVSLKKAFATGNLPDAIRALHTLKSNAGMLGATALATLSQQGETSLKSRLSHEVAHPENHADNERLVQEVERQIKLTLDQLALLLP